jgi:tetratricopeptide (TPR) repeat protein
MVMLTFHPMIHRSLAVVLLALLPSVLFADTFNEKTAEQHFEKAVEHNKRRAFGEARSELVRAVEHDPGSHKYHQALVLNYIQLRQGPAGILFYQELMKKHPKSAVVHYWLGRLYLERGSLDQAAKEFKTSAGLDPKDDHAFVALGHAYWRMGNDEGAYSAYQEANRLAPDIASVHAGLGNVYYKKKEYAKAQAAYEKAVALETVMPDARYNLGLIYERNGEFAKAVAQWNAILEADPNEVQARERLAGIYLMGEQYEDAAREYSLISRLKPLSAETFVALGESLILLAGTLEDPADITGLRESAVDAFQQALEIEPKNEKALSYLEKLNPAGAP